VYQSLRLPLWEKAGVTIKAVITIKAIEAIKDGFLI
jgi:hypothetical protein